MMKTETSKQARKEKAIRHLSQVQFHRSFTLPANPAHGRDAPLRVTYADVDYRNYPHGGAAPGEFAGGPVVVFVPGMFGARYVCAGNLSALARKHRVRLIAADKFGLGGTERVGIEWRVKGYVDLIEALLAHLNIKHVAFASHSAGTIYILNCALKLRHLLHPTNPFICLLSPWVHPSRSGEKKWSFVPDALLSQTDKLIGFVHSNINPALNFSTGLVSSAKSLSGIRSMSRADTKQDDDDDEVYDEFLEYGAAEVTGDIYFGEVVSYLFAESTQGGTEDAILCLKRGAHVSWGYFEDFDDAIPRVCAAEVARGTERPQTSTIATETGREQSAIKSHAAATEDANASAGEDSQNDRLRVDIYFADSDFFSGTKGRVWMDALWRRSRAMAGGEGAASATGNDTSGIIYNSTVVEGSDHDSIAEPRFGVVDGILADVRRLWGST